MARFCFVVPPLTGHVNPTIGVAEALRARGHEVAWVAHPGVVRPLLPAGATLFTLDDRMPERLFAEVAARGVRVPRAAALKFLWEEFILPLARSMVPGVEDAVAAFEPDVMVVDQQALAGAVVARRAGLPWATLATTTGELTDPYQGMPKVAEWITARLADLQVAEGLDPGEDPRWSPRLVVVFSTEAMLGAPAGPAGPTSGEPGRGFPPHFRFVGPSFGARPAVDFPWDHLGERPRVLVTLGTVNGDTGSRFYAATLDTLGGTPASVILAAPPELVGPVPGNVLVRPVVPQLALMEHLDAVVCHAGHNTVCEALAHGVPLVVAPIKDDQPIIANQVVGAGAGVRVRFARVRAPELAEAVDAVLGEPRYREAAERIAASFRAAGGAQSAARALEGLL